MDMQETIERLERVFGAFGLEHTIPRAEIDAAEHRLGFALPSALRVLYERTGRHPLHSAHDLLVPPDELTVIADYLVIYTEGQGVTEWAIGNDALGLADPPVRARYLTPQGEQYEDQFVSVSQFLAAQAAMQAVNGALPFVGVVTLASDDANTRAIPIGDRIVSIPGLEVRVRSGAIGYAAVNFIGLAAGTDKCFTEISKAMGLPIDGWDYATLRDEV